MSRRSNRSVFFGLAVALAIAATGAVSLAQDRFSDTTDVVVVEIPVQVIRDGAPVRGLTKADFEVTEGRKKQSIVGFDVIDLTLEPEEQEGAAPQTLPVAGRRHFLLLFDLGFSAPSSIVKARRAAQDLVANSLHPSDMVAVATYSTNRGVQIPMSFTADRHQLRSAIETLALPQLVEGSVRDPLGLVLFDTGNFAGNTGQLAPATETGPGAGRGAEADAEVQELLESIETVANDAARTNSVLALTSSLHELGDLLGAVQGRKHVVYLSEGFDSSIMLGTRGSSTQEQMQIMQQNEAAMRGDVSSVNSDARFGNTGTQTQVTEMLKAFVDSGATIQSVDIGGLRTGGDVRPRGNSDDALFFLANETGGEMYRSFNNLGDAMGEMLERTSVTYLLAIQPDKLKQDGKYHRLKVKLTNAPRGTRVVHRPGYNAPTPYKALSAGQRRLSTAEQILGGREGGKVSASVLAAAFDYAPDSAYVPVLIEIDGNSFLEGHKGNALPTELYVYAIDSEGTVKDFITQAMALDLSKVEPALRQSGFKFWGNLEVPPGHYSVRVVVRNSETGSSGVAVASVNVPDYGEESALLPPMFPEPAGKWLLGREKGAENDPYDYPFLMQGQPFIPAAKPVLVSGSQTQVCLIGYNLGDGSLAARAELFTVAGDAVEGAVELTLQARPATEEIGLDRLLANLTSSAVAPGDYNLVVSVRDTESGETQTSSIPVEVSG